jgi:hypothetical protein
MGWFYRQDGQECGPVSEERIIELLASGVMRPEQPVSKRDEEFLVYIRAESLSGVDHDQVADNGDRR